jgi:hypothetical protein
VKVDLRGQHDLGEIVGFSYRLYAANFATFLLIAAVTVPLQLLIGVIQQGSDSDGATTAAALLQIPAALVSLIASAGLIVGVHDATGGTRPDFGRSIDAAFVRFGALFTTALLGGILAVLGTLAAPWLALWWLLRRDATIDGKRNWWLAIVPGVLGLYLAIRWVFEQQAVMIGEKRNWSALDDSADAVRDCWWRTLGILVVVALIQLGPVLLSQSATLLAPLAASAIIAVVFALVLPFSVTAQTLLYYDLKARKHPHDLSPDRLAAAEPDVPGESP